VSDLLPFWEPWAGRVLTLLVVAAGLTLVVFGTRWRRPAVGRPPRCRRCRYNLTGIGDTDPCPECGRVTPADRRWFGRRRWAVAAVGLAIAIGMPSYVVHRRVSVYGWEYYLWLRPLYDVFPYTTQFGPRAVSAVGRVRIVFQSDRRYARLMYGMPEGRPWTRVLVLVGGRRVGIIAPDHPYNLCVPPERIMHAGGLVRNGQDIDGNGLPDLFINITDGGNSDFSVHTEHYEIEDGAIVHRSTAFAGFAAIRVELAPPDPARPTRVEMLGWGEPERPWESRGGP